MSDRTIRRLVFAGVAILLLVVVAGAVAAVVGIRAWNESRERAEARSRADYQNPLAVIGSTQNLSFDPRDEDALVEASEEVFVGRVVELTSRADNDPTPFLEAWGPTARYSVQVEEVRKDDSPGDDLDRGATVTVNDIGVPPLGTKATVCFGNQYPEGYVDAQMLREGERYVFATEYYERNRWHELRVAPFSWMLLSEVPPDSAPEAQGEFPCFSDPDTPPASGDR